MLSRHASIGSFFGADAAHCRDISASLFLRMLAELSDTDWQEGEIETITGHHEHYGPTVLVRDATRCLALVADPKGLDRRLAQRCNRHA